MKFGFIFFIINWEILKIILPGTLSTDPFTSFEFSEDENQNKRFTFQINFNNETKLKGIKGPCSCADGECGCCSGNILQNFNINMRQQFCINMTYEAEDLSVGVKMSINEIVLLSRKVSGKTPPPLCIAIPRVNFIRFCGRFTNVYFIGRNFHACLTVETEWNNRTVFSYSFDCFRLGANGVALISPEAGGGLPHPIDEDLDKIEEYDELLENHTTKKPVKKKKRNRTRTTTTTTSKPLLTQLPTQKKNEVVPQN